MQYSISQYARLMGVHPQTLRRWEREGRRGLIPATRTPGNHRRYATPESDGMTVGYARVSCHDQKQDLPRQMERLRQHAGNQAVIIKDIGSGLNCRKPGLKRLLQLLVSGRVRELVITYKDRLLRFGSELIFQLCALLGVKVTVLEDTATKSIEATFAEDVLAILTVFSAKLYRARAHRQKPPPPTKDQLCST